MQFQNQIRFNLKNQTNKNYRNKYLLNIKNNNLAKR